MVHCKHLEAKGNRLTWGKPRQSCHLCWIFQKGCLHQDWHRILYFSPQISYAFEVVWQNNLFADPIMERLPRKDLLIQFCTRSGTRSKGTQHIARSSDVLFDTLSIVCNTKPNCWRRSLFAAFLIALFFTLKHIIEVYVYNENKSDYISQCKCAETFVVVPQSLQKDLVQDI